MLEDEPDPPVLRREVAGVLAAEGDRPGLGPDQARDGPEQEGLARPRRPDDQAVLAGGDMEPVELEDERRRPGPGTPHTGASGLQSRAATRRSRTRTVPQTARSTTATATVSASPYCVKRV